MPDRLNAEADDHNAVLEWNGGSDGSNDPANVSGYKVSWWPADNSATPVTRITAFRRLQLQPLLNDHAYFVTVASLGQDGALSAPSSALSVTPSSRRVDQIRPAMTAFFDDFDLPQSVFNELKWDTAFAACNGPAYSAVFVNTQFHAHNSLSAVGGKCGIAQTSARARTLLDLSDKGTRTISFDFDGDFGRDNMYLQFAPRQPLFSYGGTQWRQGKAFKQFSSNDIAGELRLHVNEQNAGIEIIKPDGSVNYAADSSPADKGLAMIPNVRRHWEMRVSTARVEVLVDGTKVIDTAVQLAATQYTVLWNMFSYNGPKDDIPMALHHWDNFGFTAPPNAAVQPVTHNYKINLGGTDLVGASRNNKTVGNVQLDIPDPLAGATERRLLFTLAGFAAQWDAQDKVTINGHAFNMPKPVSATPQIGWDDLVGNINPYVFEMLVPDGVLKTGGNSIVFDVASEDILNIHVEADFTPGTEPKYTAPADAIAGGKVIPDAFAIGPNVKTTGINGLQTWEQEDMDMNAPLNTKLYAAGTVPVEVEANTHATVYATGSSVGIVEVGLLVDGKVVSSVGVAKTESIPSSHQIFQWNTTGLEDGVHEVQAYACNKDGTASVAGQGDVGGYSPLLVRVTNKGGSTKVFKASPAPDIVGICGKSSKVAAMRLISGPAADRDQCLAPRAGAAALSRR